jgi:predicted AlkP superfamily phosphohydrolase/phosphomutase
MDTGEPLVVDVVRPARFLKGPMQDLLPDLLVTWSKTPASRHRIVGSPRYGSIPWPTPGSNPEGRSGNHTGEGLVIAAGKHIKSRNIKEAHILDLAPTILALLGQPVPSQMQGRALFSGSEG